MLRGPWLGLANVMVEAGIGEPCVVDHVWFVRGRCGGAAASHNWLVMRAGSLHQHATDSLCEELHDMFPSQAPSRRLADLRWRDDLSTSAPLCLPLALHL